MLQACLNGARSKREHPGIPITPAELAADALAARRAGANELHVHPRDADGDESLAPQDIGRSLSAIRAAVPGVPVGVSTGQWINPRGQARLAHIEEWEILPDYASVNLSEADAPEVMDILLSKGIGIEAGLLSHGDAERFIKLPQAQKSLRILIEMPSDDPHEALSEYKQTLAVLKGSTIDLPVLLHGEGGSVWAMVREAAVQGFSTRVGFEDDLRLPDGSTAENNAALVEAALKISPDW